MKKIPRLQALGLALAGAAVLTLAGCGGGGSGGLANTPVSPPVAPPAATTLSGTAAIGAPIAGSVVAIDVNGKVSPPAATTASGLGAFVVDVSGMTAPFFLTITGTAGGRQVVLNSIATAVGQTVNITPLTDLIVAAAAGQPAGGSLASLCAPVNNATPAGCLSALAAAATPSRLNAAAASIAQMISPFNTTGTDPLRGAFKADGTGMDGILDRILVSPALNGGDMATITLIATNTQLGQVTLPSTAGGSATAVATAPSASDVAKANAAATVLPEARACLAALSALYPATGFTAPTAAQVGPFIDASFSLGAGADKAAFVSELTDTQQGAQPGFTLEAAGLSPYDMSPLTPTETAALGSSTNAVAIVKARTSTAVTLNGSNLPTSAWIQLHASADAGLQNWKIVKGAAYAGCPGGWKLAGSGHLDMHMNARITRSVDGSGKAGFSRQWAFHIQKSDVQAASADTVVVRGPGLSAYSGDPSAPVGASQRLVLNLPSGLNTTMQIGSGNTFYGPAAEALQSCQDLAGTSAAAGTPCIDETLAAPGKLYSWELRSGGKDGTVLVAFPFQTNAVPLSKAFAQANAASLFATFTSVTPGSLAALSSAISGTAVGAPIDGVITYRYTQQATYGSHMDNCRLSLFDGSSTNILTAEQNAVGRETACTFSTAGLNEGSLAKPAGTVQNGFVSLTTIVLGNQASSGRPY
ncbi:hypothetical protein [Variovorax terrae]|uniref:Lipoprotein n=1 Tax=Variovorax terrae TaxID=2923278 RepID=A0A9X1VWV2_9BURK|nr:hypothetical protein [Variovorax terrae]MCJ0761993.1 hypothetical protein [Variovorax terrae]